MSEDRPTLLITGGTGFLGRHFALSQKQKYNIILTGRNNTQNVYAEEFSGCPVIPMDVTNIESVRDVFSQVRPQIVVHAAATKFVNLAEIHPMEAVSTNVLGSQNVARVAIEKEVGIVVASSTDKASPPVTNTYGLSKSLMERMFCALKDKTPTKFCSVRHGNILWSSGSVFHLWKKMSETKGVIKSTRVNMTLYFYSINEAIDLLAVAIDNIESLNGKILCRNMKSASIRQVLDVWTEHFGGKWEAAPKRLGERDDEFLVGASECDFASRINFNDLQYYIIDFHEISKNPLLEPVVSASASSYSRKEILQWFTDYKYTF